MTEQWIERRALVRTPASFLATRAEQRKGYVERWTAPARTCDDVRANDYELRRTEESHAVVVDWQARVVTADDWT